MINPDIEKAIKLFELGETATLGEIQETYRRLCKIYHPDTLKGEKKKQCEEKLKEINIAREVIMKYLAGYRYSFSKYGRHSGMPEAFDDAYVDQFFDGWVSKK